ncbi:hypothetical protein LEP1GSC047_3492 [Leptospira inadai serovar Lyme str. 10]|uniref:Uncharacterized protein n=2 Tax=Leptospira inadai serovar Lyme TaxID=293084 RepID=V6HXJ4_9LEPT|nr:hypothetical protein [Leptospira inadai]EQA37729.1 hypothetical protein LEP1GSC047_3492 [Leptospira inadai serovar Lyme str. 10]PNV74705.1 hypothetical protein BES34_012060 [Leptospira inadai serovar Lyme]
MEISNQASQSLMLERIANLPKEIFQAQADLNSKLLKVGIEAKLQSQALEGKTRLLDAYA